MMTRVTRCSSDHVSEYLIRIIVTDGMYQGVDAFFFSDAVNRMIRGTFVKPRKHNLPEKRNLTTCDHGRDHRLSATRSL